MEGRRKERKRVGKVPATIMWSVGIKLQQPRQGSAYTGQRCP